MDAPSSTDVIIIGGGVAGLLAARDLAQNGYSVVLLEGRDRLGGRILTVHPAGWPQPVELGAEFVHGENAVLRSLAQEQAWTTVPVPEVHWVSQGGRLHRQDDAWDLVMAGFRRIDPREFPAFGDFFAQHARSFPPQVRALAPRFVEGFESAPMAQMSSQALRESADDDSEDSRLVGGYGQVIATLSDTAQSAGARLQTGALVERVQWRPGAVRVTSVETSGETRSRTVRQARAAVLTMPLGVWRAPRFSRGRVSFTPELRAKRALARKLGYGSVVRILLRFADDFWKREILPEALRVREGAEFGYVHSVDQAIQVWWSASPAPVLVGWVGGPRAVRLSRRPRSEQVAQALQSLATTVGCRHSDLAGALQEALTHRWASDPFARGAYSYVKAGLEESLEEWGKPIADTLFFAGEATAERSELGTVTGALSSGARVAREIASVVAPSRPVRVS